MNKHHTKAIMKIFLLIVIALSSGCGQSTITASPIDATSTNTPFPSPTLTTMPVIVGAAATKIPCILSPQTVTTDFERSAEEWFQVSKSEVPNRDEYSAMDDKDEWSKFCSFYKNAASFDEVLTHNPINIATLMTMGTYDKEQIFPDKVILLANPDNHKIVTVVLTKFNMVVTASESRVDLVNEFGIWQIMWIGSRVKCNSLNDNWTTK